MHDDVDTLHGREKILEPRDVRGHDFLACLRRRLRRNIGEAQCIVPLETGAEHTSNVTGRAGNQYSSH
jgi:hypothetical protein